jgi:hypothetical protein
VEEVAQSTGWGREVGAGFGGCPVSWFHEVLLIFLVGEDLSVTVRLEYWSWELGGRKEGMRKKEGVKGWLLI